MARSASPPQGQALPGRFRRPGGAGGTVARRQGHWPLPTETVWSGSTGTGLSGRSRSSSGRVAPPMWAPLPGTISARTKWGCAGALAPGAVRASTHPTAGRGFELPGGVGGNGACRLGHGPRRMRPRHWAPSRVERDKPIFRWNSGPAHARAFPRGSSQRHRQRAEPAPGWREAPAPRRGRRCPVALGDRGVWAGRLRGGRVTGPCRLRRLGQVPPAPG